MFKKIISIIFAGLAVASYASAGPLPAQFYASSFDVNVGETVSFDLKVNPDKPVYTVGATLKYDPSILSFTDASIEKGWLPLTRSPYELTDTKNGVITRTAGYPEGVSKRSDFTKYSFTAIAPGETKVVISQGIALDAENNDSGFQNKVITIRVGGQKEATPIAEKPATNKKLSPQTITVELTGSTAVYANSNYDVSAVHKLSEKQDTVGTTTFKVFDVNGAEVFSTMNEWTTGGDDVNTAFSLPANTLSAGDYSLVVTAKYSNQKTPSVTKKDFGVLAQSEKLVTKEVEKNVIPVYAYVTFGILLLVLLFMILYNTSKGFRKFIKNF